MYVLCRVNFTNGLSHHRVLSAVLVMTGRARQPLPVLQFAVSEVHVLQFSVLRLILGFMHSV